MLTTRKWIHFEIVTPNLSKVQHYLYILTDVFVDIGLRLASSRFMYVECSSVYVTLPILIPLAIFALFRYSPDDPYVHPLLPVRYKSGMEWRRRRGGRRRNPRVNPFIYLFMCHGGARADEGVRGAAYSRRMHRTGNPTGTTVRDERDSKSHGELARGYSTPSPSLSRSSLGIYRVFTYSYV